MHCTQSAEAKHKIVMHVASVRVHHRDVNSTQSSMLHYLFLRKLFDAMKQLDPRPGIPPLRTLSFGVRVPLCQLETVERFSAVAFQESFLHREARIARVELMDLLCDKLALPRTRLSYSRLEMLRYNLGQKFIRSDGLVLWATDTQYLPETKGCHQRRDNLLLHGTDQALCCQAVLFFTVSGFALTGLTVPESVQDEMDEDSVTFILGRWFAPHDTSVDRDSAHRPICPGPLHINHCLWKFARASQTRKTLVTSTGVPTPAFNRQAHMFGQSSVEQISILNNEKHAYFGLHFPSNVVERVNMCPVFIPNTSTPDMNTWMQTVTVI